MPDPVGKSLERVGLLHEQAESASAPRRGLLAELCDPDTLQRAYEDVRQNARDLGIAPHRLASIESEGVGGLLKELSDDLRARVYVPGRPSAGPVSPKSLNQGGRV